MSVVTAGRAAPPVRWVVFATLALGQLLVEIDDAVLTIALPTIAKDLHLAPARLPWVVNGYVLCFGGLLLLGGVLADRFGSHRMLLTGLGVFVATSVAGVLAGGLGVLVAARAGQGLAAALIAPAAMSMVLQTFREPAARTRALAIWGAVTGVGVILGLIIGGVVTEWFGWRWLFGANAVAALAVSTAVMLLPHADTVRSTRRIEPIGAISATAGLFALVYTLDSAHRLGYADARTLVALALAVAGLGVFAVVQRRHPEPLVPPALLRQRRIVVADVAGLFAGAGLLGTFFFVSLFLQRTLEFSPLRTGLAYLPLMAALITAAGIAPSLTARLGLRAVLSGGFGLCGLGLLVLAVRAFGIGLPGLGGLTGHDGGYLGGVLPGMVVTGLGLGLAFVTLITAAVPGGEEHDRATGGTASGLYNTATQIGGGLGLAGLASLATTRTDHLVAVGTAPARALTAGYGAGLVAGAALLAVGMAVTLTIPRTKDAAEAPE